MSSHRRVTRSLPLIETTERHVTKKELESRPQRFQTCPPIQRKSLRDQQLQQRTSGEKNVARAICFTKTSYLSLRYNPDNKETYLNQIFRVYDTIGEGSFGTVCKVICDETNETYAIKVSKKGHLSLLGQYEEVKRWEKVGDHENLVKFFFAWEENLLVYIQLELCGTSLDVFAKENHNIPEQQQWDILIDILLGLKYLHTHELVHLDIKPDNIMISFEGVYKLGDFGLLLDLKEHKMRLRQLKRFPVSEGDAKYLAQEILNEQYTAAADVFSLGITMLELATDLVLPINGPLWHQLRNGAFDEEYFGMVPKRLRTVIRRMMNPSYLHRPSAAQILAYNHIIKMRADRQIVPRVNYYRLWRDENEAREEDNVRAVPVCLNPPANAQPRVVVRLNPRPQRRQLRAIVGQQIHQVEAPEEERPHTSRQNVTNRQAENPVDRERENPVDMEPVENPADMEPAENPADMEPARPANPEPMEIQNENIHVINSDLCKTPPRRYSRVFLYSV